MKLSFIEGFMLKITKDEISFNILDNFDPVTFNLFYRISEGQEVNALLSADHQLMALQNPGQAMWVWINPSADLNQKNKLLKSFVDYFSVQLPDSFCGFPKDIDLLTDILSHQKIPVDLYMDMMAYHCPKVIFPENVQGKQSKPEEEHILRLMEFCQGFMKDSFQVEVTMESQRKSAENLILSGNCFIWSDQDVVVSMANIAHQNKTFARINYVYTDPDFRGKRYASALTAQLSDILLKTNRIPMLYADLANPFSNRLYKKIGYLEDKPIRHIRLGIK